MKKLKLFVVPVLFFILSQYFWAQTEKIELKGTLINDLVSNPIGGIGQGTGLQGNIDLAVQLQLWKKGNFKYHALINYGNFLSSRMGDIQIANNMEAPKGYKSYELWYEHQWENARLKIGQQEINNAFAKTESGLVFINSSFGIGPEFTVNTPVSTFPFTGLGVAWTQQFKGNITLRLGLFDGDPGLDVSIPWQERLKVNKVEGSYWIGEIQWEKWGQHSMGTWHHRTQLGQNRLNGYYVMGDVPLMGSDDANPSWALFYQLGWTDKSAPVVSNYQGLGLVRSGLFTESKDGMGVAYGRAGLSQTWKDQINASQFASESVLEITYYYQPYNSFRIQPNWQYVINPAQQAGISNAMVFLLRIQLGAL